MKEITPLSHETVSFQMLDFGTSKSNSEVSKSYSWKILKTVLLQRELFLTMFYHQQFSIACYQVGFYANNYFD